MMSVLTELTTQMGGEKTDYSIKMLGELLFV